MLLLRQNLTHDQRLRGTRALLTRFMAEASGLGDRLGVLLVQLPPSLVFEIRKQIAGFEEIRTSARTIVNGGEKILSRARLMEEEITRRLVGLDTQLDRLRAATADSPA